MMKKKEAIHIFGGTGVLLGKALGRTKSAISMWPDELNDDQINMVIGAAIRKGIKVPDSLINSENK